MFIVVPQEILMVSYRIFNGSFHGILNIYLVCHGRSRGPEELLAGFLEDSTVPLSPSNDVEKISLTSRLPGPFQVAKKNWTIMGQH